MQKKQGRILISPELVAKWAIEMNPVLTFSSGNGWRLLLCCCWDSSRCRCWDSVTTTVMENSEVVTTLLCNWLLLPCSHRPLKTVVVYFADT